MIPPFWRNKKQIKLGKLYIRKDMWGDEEIVLVTHKTPVYQYGDKLVDWSYHYEWVKNSDLKGFVFESKYNDDNSSLREIE